MLNLPKPLLPSTAVCVTKSGELSMSVALNVPDASRTPSVSVTNTIDVPVISAASFVPAMLIVTMLEVEPSRLSTVNCSLAICPSANSSCAEFAVYVQLPSASISNVP